MIYIDCFQRLKGSFSYKYFFEVPLEISHSFYVVEHALVLTKNFLFSNILCTLSKNRFNNYEKNHKKE